MQRYHLADLGSEGAEHVVRRICPVPYIFRGGLSFHTPGMRTHDNEDERHPYYEVFIIMQGQGWIDINGEREPVRAGEVLLIEPGDEHHLVGDSQHPIVNLWFDLGEEPNERQCTG